MFVPEPTFTERLVVGKILQPLNLSYIPNLKQNVWPALASPWYDVGSRYTVPYTIYTTGIGWRGDKLPGFDPAKLQNPWNALWVQGPKIAGKVGLLDDQHEGLAMGLLRNGVTDLNTQNAAQLNAAKQALTQLVSSANLKFDTNEYQHLADGSLWLHQAWSGDMAATPSYAPKGTPASVFRYWWPTDGRGPINNDTFGIVKGAKNPVLAHLFLNHLLDVETAYINFTFNFYQQPLTDMTPQSLVKRGYIPPNLQTTIIREPQFKQGLRAGSAQPDWRSAVGERVGGGQVVVTARSSYWRGFALPGVGWLLLFVVVPAYAVLAMAMGRVNLLLQPVPAWDPTTWNPGFVSKAFSGALPGGEYWPAVRNTIVYVGDVAGAVLRDRLSRRLLRRAARREDQDAADRAARDPVLGQLPAADAGLDRAAVLRRLRQQAADATSGSRIRQTGSTATRTR